MKNRLFSLTSIITWLCVFSVSFTALAFQGCKPANSEIAFFIYDEHDTFIAEMMEYMISRISDDFIAGILYASNSQSVQNRQIVEQINAGTDLLVINAVDRLACGSIVEKAVKQDVPVIFFNREPLEGTLTGRNMFYVGAASDSMGMKQADMVAKLFSENSRHDKNGDGIIQLVILKGEQGHQDAEKRTDNCVSRLKELGFEIEVLSIEIADWQRDTAYEAMRSLHTQFGDIIELIISNNDDMALGAIDFLLDRGVFIEGAEIHEQPFVIVGVDGTSVGLEAIEKGMLYGTINNNFAKQSDAILELIDYITNEWDLSSFPHAIANDHYIYIDGDIITGDNLEAFRSSFP